MSKKQAKRKSYFKYSDWRVDEDRFKPGRNLHCETIFNLANGYMGVRGMLEEGFPGKNTLQGCYIAGLYELEKIPYIWQRKNEPSFSAKIPNSTNWIGIKLRVSNEPFNMLNGKIKNYKRILNFKEGTLVRKLVWTNSLNRQTEINICRIVSMDDPHIGAISYKIKPLNYSGRITLECSLDGDVRNQDSQVVHWEEVEKNVIGKDGAYLAIRTNITKFTLGTAMKLSLTSNGEKVKIENSSCRRTKYISKILTLNVKKGREYKLEKIVVLYNSRDKIKGTVKKNALSHAKRASKKGFDAILTAHKNSWARKWEDNDVSIEGDASSQQGIRYSIFQLFQTYSGDNPMISIGAKGLTGEHYRGVYFWESETYLFPFYLYADPPAAKSLLLFRYNILKNARREARNYGYDGAKFAFVTINGDDTCGDWEYGLEHHINASIPYAIWQYVESTDDMEFLLKYGLEVMIETSRFWVSRAVYNHYKRKYVINTVTGPDEYALVVNNNCYTNSMAQFSIKYTLDAIRMAMNRYPLEWKKIVKKNSFNNKEIVKWTDVIKKISTPFDRKLGIHLQDDQVLDRDNVELNSAVPKPLYKDWAYERIIRCNLVKQADVILLMYMLNDKYSHKVKKANYDFYEPKTTHDSSLSPCIHSIIASELAYYEDAFKYYLMSSRIDLDDYDQKAYMGIHIACAAGSWLVIASGFAGMRVKQGQLSFNPYLPKQWKGYTFKMKFKDRLIKISIEKRKSIFSLERGNSLKIKVRGKVLKLQTGREVEVS